MQNRIRNHFRQYGFFNATYRGVMAILKPIYKIKSNLVLAIYDHDPKRENCIAKEFVLESLDEMLRYGIINDGAAKRLRIIIENNSKGYYIVENNIIAGSAFIQTKGSYKYGNYFYNLPDNVWVLKNLMVEPDHRGKSFGKILNMTRINNIPKEAIPVGFVIPENRFAIRNLKMFGFEEIIYVRHTTWLNRWTVRKIKILKQGKITDTILSGFETKLYN